MQFTQIDFYPFNYYLLLHNGNIDGPYSKVSLVSGFSDYDLDYRSVTDDTDDYSEILDVVDDLENVRPEIKERVDRERRISRTRISDLERALEGTQDEYRANVVSKDRQIKSLQREIEGELLFVSSGMSK